MKINQIKTNNLSQKVANFIEKSPKVQEILKKVDKNPSLFNAIYVATLATTLKPLSILSIPQKTEDGKLDAKYAASKNIGTGILDLLVALAIFMPLNKKLDKVGRDLFDEKNSIYFKNKEMCSNYKSVMNRFIKIGTLPLFAYLKFNMIEPLCKILFKKEKNNEDSQNRNV
jgi:hypothetical protein